VDSYTTSLKPYCERQAQNPKLGANAQIFRGSVGGRALIQTEEFQRREGILKPQILPRWFSNHYLTNSPTASPSISCNVALGEPNLILSLVYVPVS